jgi:hypothetical protein
MEELRSFGIDVIGNSGIRVFSTVSPQETLNCRS